MLHGGSGEKVFLDISSHTEPYQDWHLKIMKKKAKPSIQLIQTDLFEDDLKWNDEIVEDIQSDTSSELVVYSRDWTIATIVSQIEQSNIDLNPKFQRRNAWDDARRSKLIESLVASLPVPEIVLAEDPQKKKAFIVIDGKQRLLTIAGFLDPTIDYWKKAELRGLKLRPELNGQTFDQIKADPDFSDQYREFMNADVRCTIISNFKSDDALYDIFYRLNTGSVPLSTQELRQVLHKGPFADHLITITSTFQPIHEVLGLTGPDTRLKDVEVVLRFIGIVRYGTLYQGNLKKFLDTVMETVTSNWSVERAVIDQTYSELNTGISNLTKVLGKGLIGRKYVDGAWESRFNRVLFEVEAFYLRLVPADQVATGKVKFVKGLQALFANPEFRSSVESTTKTNDRYELRFQLMRDLVNESFGTSITAIPVKA